MIQNHVPRPGVMLAATLMLSTLAGCSQPRANSDAPLEPSRGPAATVLSLPGEWAYPMDVANQWLTVGEISGIRHIADGVTLDHLAVSAEYLAHRSTATGPLFASFDSERGQPLFFTINGEKLTRLDQETAFHEPVEGLCLYQGEALYLFLLSEQSRAHQFLVQRTENRIDLHPVRTVPIPPASIDCAVDDASATLYVAESDVGVWAYGADPEAELARTPVAMTTPFGELAQGPTALAANSGRLLILAGNRVVQAQGNDSELVLENTVSAETLTVRWSDEKARLSVYDETSENLHVVDWPVGAVANAEASLASISARVETDPVPSAGDAADDPAIWVNQASPSESRVLGTNKRQGLHVYDLDGQELQSLPVGRLNNVDVRYGVPYHGDSVDIAVATNRTRNSLNLFAIRRQDGRVLPVTEIATDLTEIYGLCLYQPDGDHLYAFANDKSGRYVQYRLTLRDDQWQGAPVREFAVNSQPEGCVADDQRGRLFVGEEGQGIWVTRADPDGASPLRLVATLGKWLAADVEGLALYGGEYLVASSQGDNSYAVYQATPPFEPVGAFRVGMNLESLIDGASETDGLAVTASNLGGPWNEGMLVVQDGRNVLPAQAQNFKMVPWQSVRRTLDLPVPE